MSYLKKHIVDQIHDLESPLNDRMTFEEVMNRREKKKRRLLLFWPRLVVVGGLFTAAGLGYYVWNSSHGKLHKQVVLVSAKAKKSETTVNSQIETTASANYVGPMAEKILKPNADNAGKSRVNAIDNMGGNEIKSTALPSSAAILKSSTDENLSNNTKNIYPEILESQVKSTNPTQTYTNNSVAEIFNERLEESAPKLNPDITHAAVLVETKDEDLIVKKNSAMDAEGVKLDIREEVRGDYFVNLDRLMQLSHSKGLQMFEIPNPLSESDFTAVFVDLEGDEQNRYFRPGNFNSPYHVELSVGTGSRVLTNFDQTLPMSILGNQYNAHYQLGLLKDLTNGLQIALGVSYGEWEGIGEWQKQQWNSYTVRDSSVLIGFPNPNDRQVIYFDSLITELTTTRGGISYQINKISVPIGFRKLMYVGKVPFRVAMQVAPGRTTKSSGYYFNDFEFHSIENQTLTTADFKVALGPSFNIHRHFTAVIEPNANMQTFYDSRSKRVHSKSFWGFGFSLIRHFN